MPAVNVKGSRVQTVIPRPTVIPAQAGIQQPPLDAPRRRGPPAIAGVQEWT